MKLKIFSKAAHSTWIFLPEFHLLFDCGDGCSTMLGINQIASINNIIVSHHDADHISGLYNLIRLRSRHGKNIPQLIIWIPESNKINKLIEFIGPHNNIEWAIYGNGSAKQNIPVNNILEVQPFQTNHCYNSFGFNLIEKRKKLKEEYKHLSGVELGRMRMDGVELDQPYSKILLTYTGDTPPIKDCSIFSRTELLICDCTYLESVDNNENYKHCTLTDAWEMFRVSAANKMIGIHLSARYDLNYINKIYGEKPLIDAGIRLADPDRINVFEF